MAYFKRAEFWHRTGFRFVNANLMLDLPFKLRDCSALFFVCFHA